MRHGTPTSARLFFVLVFFFFLSFPALLDHSYLYVPAQRSRAAAVELSEQWLMTAARLNHIVRECNILLWKDWNATRACWRTRRLTVTSEPPGVSFSRPSLHLAAPPVCKPVWTGLTWCFLLLFALWCQTERRVLIVQMLHRAFCDTDKCQRSVSYWMYLQLATCSFVFSIYVAVQRARGGGSPPPGNLPPCVCMEGQEETVACTFKLNLLCPVSLLFFNTSLRPFEESHMTPSFNLSSKEFLARQHFSLCLSSKTGHGQTVVLWSLYLAKSKYLTTAENYRSISIIICDSSLKSSAFIKPKWSGAVYPSIFWNKRIETIRFSDSSQLNLLVTAKPGWKCSSEMPNCILWFQTFFFFFHLL